MGTVLARHLHAAGHEVIVLSRSLCAAPWRVIVWDGDTAGDWMDAFEGADVVMMLRVQRERLEEDFGDAPGEYLARYGLTAKRLQHAAPNAVVMHPGPINRGVEIADEVADDQSRSLITLQVEMGVAVRMACLEMLVGA